MPISIPSVGKDHTSVNLVGTGTRLPPLERRRDEAEPEVAGGFAADRAQPPLAHYKIQHAPSNLEELHEDYKDSFQDRGATHASFTPLQVELAQEHFNRSAEHKGRELDSKGGGTQSVPQRTWKEFIFGHTAETPVRPLEPDSYTVMVEDARASLGVHQKMLKMVKTESKNPLMPASELEKIVEGLREQHDVLKEDLLKLQRLVPSSDLWKSPLTASLIQPPHDPYDDTRSSGDEKGASSTSSTAKKVKDAVEVVGDVTEAIDEVVPEQVQDAILDRALGYIADGAEQCASQLGRCFNRVSDCWTSTGEVLKDVGECCVSCCECGDCLKSCADACCNELGMCGLVTLCTCCGGVCTGIANCVSSCAGREW